MDAFMGAPTHPLLGAADNYAFPMTNGLIGSFSQPTDWSQVALNLAGNPHAGPYANAQGLPAATGSAGLQAGSGTASTGSQIATGLLGALAKNPSLIKDGYNAVSGLLGDGLSAYGTGAAADAAVASTLAPTVASELGTTAASIEGANDAALASQLASEGVTPIASSAAPAAAAPAASGASTGLLSSLGALAIPAAIFASYETTNPVNESAAWWNDMTNRLGSSDPSVSNLARLTVANDYLNGGGDMPLSQAQLAQYGITPQYLADISRQITSPAPGGKGWLGGGFTGASRA